MSSKAYAVIMAGGKGERFWPLSTGKQPKQVLSVFSGRPMLAMAVDYVRGLIPTDQIYVITSADLVDVVCRAVPVLKRQNVIGEPFGRDTAAVCALATALVGARDPDGIICTLTADHIIKNLTAFQMTLKEGIGVASSHDVLITIGIPPTLPSTGFGYIEAGNPMPTRGQTEFLAAKRFVEKPDLKTAGEYVASGRYYWNAGMFIWSVKAFQKALGLHRPALLEMAKTLQPVAGKPRFARVLKEEYGTLEKISVDYAVMEQAKNIVMAKGTFGWDDVGSWLALQNHFQADDAGNIAIGDMEGIDATNNIVVSGDRLTALIGVKDLVVVQAGKATLVCAKDRAQDVKKIVQRLAQNEKYKSLL